jgi:2'-5' RNA ligase
MTRLFVAITLDEKIKEKITGLYEKFPKNVIKAKFVPKDNIHITLKFIGEKRDNDISDIIETLKHSHDEIGTFSLHIKGVGAFPHSFAPKIIWVGANGPKIEELAQSIDDHMATLGIKKEQKPYKAHITFARVKSVYEKRDVNDIIQSLSDIEIGTQNVTSFSLVKSTLTPKGPIYSTVKDFFL